jgi:hypothetical protein
LGLKFFIQVFALDISYVVVFRFSPLSSNEMSNMMRAALPNIKVTRFKGKRAYPSLPNQPSEASAHFMFELAKQVPISRILDLGR